MVVAATLPLASSEEKTNGAKLSRLLIDGGTTALRAVFDTHHPPANLAADLNACYPTLNNLFRRRILNGHQWDKLVPPGGAAPDSKTFDITLLFLLLTNICGLSPPSTGWNFKPAPSDTSLEANLARVKFFRNHLYGHVTSTGVDTPTFNALWMEIRAVLVALGLGQADIDRLKAEQCGEESYLGSLRDWAENEEDIKTHLREIHHILNEIRQIQLNTEKEDDKILKKLALVDTQRDVSSYTARYQEGTRESILVKVQSWLDDASSPNRVLVISGDAGMGKSVVAAEISRRMQEAGRLSGSHFCHHDRARHRNPKVMLQSLASHVSCCLPEYKEALVEQLSRNLGVEINSMEVADLFELLFEVPLGRVTDPGVTSLVVIDALDESECQGRIDLLDVIAKDFNKLPPWLRFLVTTRPEVNISDRLKDLKQLPLEPNDEENLRDISLFFQQNLSDLLEAENSELVLDHLVQKSEGVFLCAQLAVDLIKAANCATLSLECLDKTLPSGLSSVYESYFQRLEKGFREKLKVTKDQFLSFLSAMVAARKPLPLGFVSRLLSSLWREVKKVIAFISSLFRIQNDCIHFVHKSVKDWMTDKLCYGQHSFTVEEDEGHYILSALCREELDELKRKGVCNSQPLTDTAKYALEHGVQHMVQLNQARIPYSLQEVVDLDYAELFATSSTASEEIVNDRERSQYVEVSKAVYF